MYSMWFNYSSNEKLLCKTMTLAQCRIELLTDAVSDTTKADSCHTGGNPIIISIELIKKRKISSIFP